MYRNCIFCSSDLGTNDSIEEFPVGRALAFDAWKGRLWAVCAKCARWNLTPIEERWEAVEACEKQFVDSRLRVHSENIGLAKLRDGTRLIRVGEAVPRELAAWRYGDQLTRRRRRFFLGAGATTVGGLAAVVGGIPLLAASAVPVVAAGYALQVVGNLWIMRNQMRAVHRIDEEASPTGKPIVIRQAHVQNLRVVPSEAGAGIAVEIPLPLPSERQEKEGVVRWIPPPPLRLEGEESRRVLERTLVMANASGARERQLGDALQVLGRAPNPSALLDDLAGRQAGLFASAVWSNSGTGIPDIRGAFRRFVGTFRGELIRGAPLPAPTRTLPRAEVLALEMALHEESERRALEGELAMLEAAWREAEEVAAIADALPDDPLEELK